RGEGLSLLEQVVLNEEFANAGAPMRADFFGDTLVGPTIMQWGTEEQKKEFIPGILQGKIAWCQGFSEPNAGSDLASLKTTAKLDGDEWIINGQKVWTSGAQRSDIGEIICRTDPDLPKHRGLTGFVVDMHAPGVEVRPLRQMTGGASFNEVFFTDVRVPDSHRLGDVNGGWTVALTTLMNERAAIGGGGGGGVGLPTATRLIELARASGKADDPLIRQQLASVYINDLVSRYTTLRSMAKIAVGQLPGPEMSLAKLSLTANMVRTYELVSSILGPALVADTGAWGTYAWTQFLLGVPGMRVAGGTDEVLHNIIGERVLGLPKQPSPK
ncbi:MAG TPA: acyl-CoA dehydrogenase family protein, partial [Acidimicrobiales bacterium]|nr:acyl-CoA dehydrogenase family protein [Acidimicrobiales bacterium]